MLNKIISFFILTILISTSYAQEAKPSIERNARVTFINPGIEYEVPFSRASSALLNVGIGVGGSYKNLYPYLSSGVTVMLAPFYDFQLRNYYNLSKRVRKGKSTKYNSANFVGLRLLVRGPDIVKTNAFRRLTDYDYAIAPVWGVQHAFGRFHLLFDIGPYVYFDFTGRSGVLPMFELNIGYNLFKK